MRIRTGILISTDPMFASKSGKVLKSTTDVLQLEAAEAMAPLRRSAYNGSHIVTKEVHFNFVMLGSSNDGGYWGLWSASSTAASIVTELLASCDDEMLAKMRAQLAAS